MTTTNGCESADYEKVPWAWRCPQCGEDNMDRLVWVDDDHVRCESCGMVYDPNRGEAAD